MLFVINLLQSTKGKSSSFKWLISKGCTSKGKLLKSKPEAILKTPYSQMSNFTINGILEKVFVLICFFIEYMERLTCYGVPTYTCVQNPDCFGNYFLIICFSVIGYRKIGFRLKSNFYEGNLLADGNVDSVYFMMPLL